MFFEKTKFEVAETQIRFKQVALLSFFDNDHKLKLF
jgi:hypothetical protein